METKKFKDYFCIGDIHTKFQEIDTFLRKHKPDKCIWLADFLDNHEDSNDIFDTIQTGIWLKEIMTRRPNDIFLESNHMLPYHYPGKDAYKNWGWTKKKHEAFHSVFPAALFKRFKAFHEEDFNGTPLIFSHAGFTERFLPNGRWDAEFMSRIEQFMLANAGHTCSWFDDYEGPLWIRFPALPLLYKTHQAVGHTFVEKPTLIGNEENWKLGLDCLPKGYIGYFKEDSSGSWNVYSYNIRNNEKNLLI